MDRMISDNERLRRAEEIYSKRNKNSYISKNDSKVITSFNKYKIALNLILVLNMAIIFVAIKNNSFIFTNEFMDAVNSYSELVTKKVYSCFYDFFNTPKEENIETVENNQEEVIESNENNSEVISLSQMNIDIYNLNNAYSFINPIEGVISSRFGNRVSEYKNVSSYHTGIDIAQNKGTKIKASMQGIVTEVSSKGDYGKHLKIRCNNVITLYAHCSEIFVKEGEIVGQGQIIATVGSSGNTTGPHLHFEIRVDDRFVDPLKILSI